MDVLEIVKKLEKELPKFPDGRINYSKSKIAPVITVFVKYNDKILLLKRSDRVSTYKGKWNTVAGYLDEVKSLEEKALEELREEIGVDDRIISSIKIGKMYEFYDEKIDRKWIVTPILVELKELPKIKLNEEHTEYKWIKIDEIENFDTVPNLMKSLKIVLEVNKK